MGAQGVTSTDEQRWRQRLASFGTALARLDEACEQDSYSNLERAGLARTFEFTFELGWKVLKDLLFYEGHDANSPRETIRKSFEAGYIGEEDCETFLYALSTRKTMSHVYKDELAREAEVLIKLRYHPMLRRLWRALERKSAG